jgi:hypothetical protein
MVWKDSGDTTIRLRSFTFTYIVTTIHLIGSPAGTWGPLDAVAVTARNCSERVMSTLWTTHEVGRMGVPQ